MMKAHRLRRDGFTCFAAILLLLASVVTLAPVVLMALSSLTEEKVLLQDGYSFFPRAFSTEAYRTLLVQQTSIVGSYVNSVLVTLIGTSVHLVLTLTFAYPLSRADFKYRNLFSFLVFFTMLFNGGVVPSYIMWTRFFSIRNTLWALIVPNYLMSAFNVILCKNYLRQNIPAAVLEAAEIDGAREGVSNLNSVSTICRSLKATNNTIRISRISSNTNINCSSRSGSTTLALNSALTTDQNITRHIFNIIGIGLRIVNISLNNFTNCDNSNCSSCIASSNQNVLIIRVNLYCLTKSDCTACDTILNNRIGGTRNSAGIAIIKLNTNNLTCHNYLSSFI